MQTNRRSRHQAPSAGARSRTVGDLFALDGRDCITAEEHFGIKSFMLAASIPYRNVAAIKGLWAPPYASPDFALEVRLCGEQIPADDYWWNGNECRRWGRLHGVRPSERAAGDRDLRVASAVTLPMERRGGLLELRVTNAGSAAVTVPVQLSLRGGVDQVSFWEFAGPASSEAGQPWAARALGWTVAPDRPDLLIKTSAGGALAVGVDLEGLRWETLSGHWEGTLSLAPRQRRTFCVAFAIGLPEAARADCLSLLEAGPRAAAAARAGWRRQAESVFARLPRLEASDARLVRFYHRSLVHLLLNQWRVPEFVVQPYYSTGGINGGCVCCYLWDFGEPWELLPLYDPEALKAHVRQFLSVDITRHFAWVPTTGEAFGPWYPVNQEKVIFLVYYYVCLTGDTSFLHEQVAGRRVVDWVLYHATYRDCACLPVGLIDYGKGNNHLELRGAYRYDGHLPDLNGRRYGNLQAAASLCRLAGVPAEGLLARAETLKCLLRRLMWDPDRGWFRHLDENYQPDLRWTVQMFKLVGSHVLDGDQLEGLLGHLNEAEFLSAWGLHSLSKLDPAYDQVDIDNGGGGNYTAFTPQIAERCWRAGRDEQAADLLRRILWWGDRLPYWGDSIVANQMDYRRDTPLQNTIGALAGAQALIFGMFGISVAPEGAVTIHPRPPAFAPEISLRGLRIRGWCLDIEAAGGTYTVTGGGQTWRARIGTPTVLPPALPGQETHG